MADKPILFSGPMVRALLEGRKTMTRRTLDPELESSCQAGDILVRWGPQFGGSCARFRPKYAVGDRLWVREGLAADSNDQGIEWPCYAVDRKAVWPMTAGWRWKNKALPSIHMPRWASRLTLIVESVKVERLQDISEEDAIAEGCAPDEAGLNPNSIGPAKAIFEQLWNSINGPGAWDANPWVAAIGFRVIKANIDSAEAR